MAEPSSELRARDYLIRNVLRPLHPNIEPLDDLLGVCTQVDSVTAGLVRERDALRKQLEALRSDARA